MSPSREDEVGETNDLSAAWYACQAITPVLDDPEATQGRVLLLKVNVDESPALAARYGIRSIPTLLFFKDGTLVGPVVGAAPKSVLPGIVNARAS